MDTGYYKSLKNIAHTDDLKERVLENEIIQITGIEEEYNGIAITFLRFGQVEKSELFFAKMKKEDLKQYFIKI